MTTTNVLDHGYVNLIETWGSDERIIEAARMSTDKGFLGWGPKTCFRCAGGGTLWRGGGVEKGGHEIICDTCKGEKEVPGDEKLLRFLWEYKHHTPFEMAGAVFEIKAPIFVFREWHRHRTQSYNEMSARYVPLPDENYVPSVERLLAPGGHNKQAQGTGAHLDEKGATAFQGILRYIYALTERNYQHALTSGVPKELARLVIPVGRYSKMRASANLRNWMGFLTLRNDPNAQYEIQVYAQAVQAILKEAFPRAVALFEED